MTSDKSSKAMTRIWRRLKVTFRVQKPDRDDESPGAQEVPRSRYPEYASHLELENQDFVNAVEDLVEEHDLHEFEAMVLLTKIAEDHSGDAVDEVFSGEYEPPTNGWVGELK